LATHSKVQLYSGGSPVRGFNPLIKRWLDGTVALREHKPPAAFAGIRDAYRKAIVEQMSLGLRKREAHRQALSNLTKLLFGHDLATELKARLAPDLVNAAGFRSTLSQGFAKNVGENFVNLIVYRGTVMRQFAAPVTLPI